MERVIKLQATNSIVQDLKGDGSITPIQPLLDFKIHGDGSVYDLSQSYVALKVELDHHLAPIGGFDGLVKMGAGVQTDTNGFLDSSHAGDSTSLVKNLQFYSQSRGMIESVRRLDTLKLAQRYYEKDDQELQRDLDLNSALAQPRGTGLFEVYNIDEVRVVNAGEGVTDAGVGANKSRSVVRDLRMHLKDILGIGGATLFDSGKYGDCDLHLELNLDKFRALTLQANEGNNHAGVDMKAMDDQAGLAGGAVVFQFTTTATYDNPELECPFFIGQRVNVAGTASVTNPNPNVACVIKEISYTAATKKLLISVNQTVLTANGAGENLTGITITPNTVDSNNIDIKIRGAELHLVAVKNPQGVPDQIDYVTYTTEEIDGGNNATIINKRAKLEPNAQTLYVANCHSNQIAPDRTLNSYRMSIDNVDVSGNREVVFDSGVQRDRIIRAYRNRGVPLKNLNQRLMKITRDQKTTRADSLAVIVEPLELTNEEKTLQLKLVAGANHQDIILYKEVVKSI
jgi:hypothetical protein